LLKGEKGGFENLVLLLYGPLHFTVSDKGFEQSLREVIRQGEEIGFFGVF
jgi:hypothetical protein